MLLLPPDEVKRNHMWNSFFFCCVYFVKKKKEKSGGFFLHGGKREPARCTNHVKLFISCISSSSEKFLKKFLRLFAGQDGSFRIGMMITIDLDDDRAWCWLD